MLLQFGLIGCSTHGWFGEQAQPTEFSSIEELSKVENPFELKVTGDRWQGPEFEVEARLFSRVTYPADLVGLRLVLLNGPEQLVKQEWTLAEMFQDSDRLIKGRSYDVRLSERVDTFTSYQLELLWGPEVKSITDRRNRPSDRLWPELEKSMLVAMGCAKPPCGRRLDVLVRLTNRSEERVCDGVKLRVGIERGGEAVISQSATGRQVDRDLLLDRIRLEPGASQLVRFSYSTELPAEGDFAPRISNWSCVKGRT